MISDTDRLNRGCELEDLRKATIFILASCACDHLKNVVSLDAVSEKRTDLSNHVLGLEPIIGYTFTISR